MGIMVVRSSQFALNLSVFLKNHVIWDYLLSKTLWQHYTACKTYQIYLTYHTRAPPKISSKVIQ